MHAVCPILFVALIKLRDELKEYLLKDGPSHSLWKRRWKSVGHLEVAGWPKSIRIAATFPGENHNNVGHQSSTNIRLIVCRALCHCCFVFPAELRSKTSDSRAIDDNVYLYSDKK